MNIRAPYQVESTVNGEVWVKLNSFSSLDDAKQYVDDLRHISRLQVFRIINTETGKTEATYG